MAISDRTSMNQNSGAWSPIGKMLAPIAERDGYLYGDFGENLDEPELWSLVTHWANVGSYRRALSSTQIKMEVVPLLALAIDEPGAYSNDL